MKNQKGFSLIELLVVVIIIAIIAAIAIPSLLASRRAANQSATVANLRTIVSANATHASLNQGAYAATFAALAGGTQNLIDDSWAAAIVTKNGYTYTYVPSGTVGYCVEAETTAAQGDNAYAVSHQGVIYGVATPATSPVCVPLDGTFTSGAPIGS